MNTENTHVSNLGFMRLFLINRLMFLLGLIFILPNNVFAESIIKDNDAVISEEISIHQELKSLPVKEVEAGPGGNIKQERKYRTKIESLYEWHAHLLWESRYVTEGRDNLAGKSLVSVSTEFSVEEFSVVPWVAGSGDIDYSEFNLNVVYGSRFTEKLTLYTGYNYVYTRSFGENTDDNEISFDLAYNWLKHVNALASIYHSFDASGSFMEVTLKYNNKINNMLFYSVHGVLGTNAGYVADGHNGPNHFQLRANASYYPLTQLELYTYAGYNMAINRDAAKYAGDETLTDFLWGGIGLSYLF